MSVGAIVLAGDAELFNAQVALLERFISVPLEHQSGGSPDIDLEYHVATGARLQSSKV